MKEIGGWDRRTAVDTKIQVQKWRGLGMAMDYGKTIQNMTKSDESAFFSELNKRERKSAKLQELAIVPYIGDAFLEVIAGNVTTGNDFIEHSFKQDKEKLTTKLFESVVKQVVPHAIVNK